MAAPEAGDQQAGPIVYSVIIPAYNRGSSLARCLRAITTAQAPKPYEIIVVDDQSSDNTPEVATTFGVNLIRNPIRSGPSTARNLGAKAAQGEVLIFVDSDVLFAADTFTQLDNFFLRHHDYDGVSGHFNPRCEMPGFFSRYKHLCTCSTFFDQPLSVRWAYSSLFAVKKQAFLATDGFPEQIKLHEDGILARDLTQRGFKLGFLDSLRVQHLHSYTFKSFVRERPIRSRTRMVMTLTNKVKGIEIGKEPVAQNMKRSIMLAPFLAAGVVASYWHAWLVLIPAIPFYLGNVRFLRFTTSVFGLGFTARAALLLPLDGLLCWVGIVQGVVDFMRGARM